VKLEPEVAALVLLAALMHASWNAIVKSDRDRLLSFSLVMMAGTLMALAVLPFVGSPARASWPYLAASTAVHCVYYVVLLRAYAHGDLSHVYPIARGLGPLVVAALSGRLIGEALSTQEIAGVVGVCGGIASLAFVHGWRGGKAIPTLYALATGCAIAAYTILDGLGARASGDAFGYITWLNILEGPWVLIAALLTRPRDVLPYVRQHWARGTAGGIIATLGYAIAIWAMSVSAMAHVAVLRETSVLIAAVLGAVVLKESFGLRRIGAAALVVAGLLLMNLPPLR
jgi:drug/metabolite transporter (DMT)-like permease